MLRMKDINTRTTKIIKKVMINIKQMIPNLFSGMKNKNKGIIEKVEVRNVLSKKTHIKEMIEISKSLENINQIIVILISKDSISKISHLIKNMKNFFMDRK